MNNSEFDPRDFRRALGQFPTGVTVITTLDDNENPVCMTASSFNSVSIDPALVLWSIDKKGSNLNVFEKASHFAINILGKEQVGVSNQFARHGDDKYDGISFNSGVGGSPLLQGCAAQFECKTWNVYEGGDHLIIVGEVLNYSYDETANPLLFSQGSYAVSMQHPSSMKTNEPKLKSDGGFLADFLLHQLRRSFNNFSSQIFDRFMEEYHISPEQWGVLALLSNFGAMPPSQLSQFVMQPTDVFAETEERMREMGLVVHDGDLSELTEEGERLAQTLLAIAKEHESAVLGSLTQDQVDGLKASLKVIASS